MAAPVASRWYCSQMVSLRRTFRTFLQDAQIARIAGPPTQSPRYLPHAFRRESSGLSPPDLSRKAGRSRAAKTTFPRATKEAPGAKSRGRHGALEAVKRDVTAYCAAEEYNIAQVSQMLQDVGYRLDPCNTRLSPHVVHFRYPPFGSSGDAADQARSEAGDVFIFPNGTVVAWNVEEEYTKRLVSKSLVQAAKGSHPEHMEMEDLTYYEDSANASSQVQGDLIVLGTRLPDEPVPADAPDTALEAATTEQEKEELLQKSHHANLVLAKIAFSSGLARSTKVAVLESELERYFDSTRDIPTVLSTRRVLPYTRRFILRKTGELLRMRAQLNLSSELTDALPDLFWDSRYELGLEGYFVQVSRALDVGVRIKTLNEKMNYAQEIASVLQERLSEKHGLFLEWLIIILISIEVCFELGKMIREAVGKKDEDSVQSLLKQILAKMEAEEVKP